MKIRLVIVIVVAVVLTGCPSDEVLSVEVLNVKSKSFGVELEAKPAQNTVKIHSKAQGWEKSGKKDGYVGYARGESGVTVFYVKHEELDGSCANSADWVITRLRLATEGEIGSEKGSNFGLKQEPWLLEAFPALREADNGVLFDVNRAGGQTFLPVFNANRQKGERFIYYEVTLTPCSDGDLLTTDPGWGNGGRN